MDFLIPFKDFFIFTKVLRLAHDKSHRSARKELLLTYFKMAAKNIDEWLYLWLTYVNWINKMYNFKM